MLIIKVGLNVVLRNLIKKSYIFLMLKHIVAILGTPFQVINILAYAVASANQIQKLSRRNLQPYL